MKLQALAVRIRAAFRKPADTDTENPYLNARRTWNSNVGALVSSRFVWQMVGLYGLMIGLAGVGATIHFATQSKYIPFIVHEDERGRLTAEGPLDAARPPSQRVIEGVLGDFISDARLVTPDAGLLKKAHDRAYAKLPNDSAARARMLAWHQGDPPPLRAEKFVVNAEDVTVLAQSDQTVQIDWKEVTHDRKGGLVSAVNMRAIVTYFIPGDDVKVPLEILRLNPAMVMVRDYSWTQVK